MSESATEKQTEIAKQMEALERAIQSRSLPSCCSVGVPSSYKTATEVEMLIILHNAWWKRLLEKINA